MVKKRRARSANGKAKNRAFKVTPEVEAFIDAYVKAIEDRTAAIFAGAGLSIPAGFVDWRGLLRNIAREIRLNVDKEHDLIGVAQFHANEKGGRGKINQAVVNEFSRKSKATDNHRILSRLPIQTYWTTNYDKLIEDSLASAQKTPDVKITNENLAINVQLRDAIVYKMHGDVSLPHDVVVTKDDYEDYNVLRQPFSTALQGDLLDKTFLFLGFSFNDPNIGYILSRIRILLGRNQREHFCLMRRVHRPDFKTNAEFHYARTKQELQIRDLKRFAVTVILMDDYKDATVLLRMIEHRVRRKRVFISGSAATYDPLDETESRQFIHDLSKQLVAGGFEVVSGFGLGVGDAVINGALDHVFSTGHRRLERHLILRPFPQFATGGKTLPELWTEYRENMLDESGIAIFLFGNKIDKKTGTVTLANGMEEECAIALAKGIPVIPVGFTGSTSMALWAKLKGKDFEWKTAEVAKAIAGLEKAPSALKLGIHKILKAVKLLQAQD